MSEIIAVSGMTRCGSSLVMQMLSAAGVPTIGKYPDFEDERVFESGYYPYFKGHAVKLLDPHNGYVPSGHSYRWVWLDRAPEQQAKSVAKFLKWQGVGLKDGAEPAFAESFVDDRPKAMAVIEALNGPVLTLRFEEIITQPLQVALALIGFLGIANEFAPSMVRCVRPRSTDCLPYMLEDSLLRDIA